MFAGAAEAARASFCFREGIDSDEIHIRQFANDHLGDSFAAFDMEWFGADIHHYHAYFSAISGVDGSRGVKDGQGVFQCEAASGPDLRFVTDGQFKEKTGGNEVWFTRFKDHVLS